MLRIMTPLTRDTIKRLEKFEKCASFDINEGSNFKASRTFHIKLRLIHYSYIIFGLNLSQMSS
jgi:hypothetical protein